ncbi:helix-turn-helix domain-containing protein [Paenibacillus wulumuqiensis]|uniref:helix-turn-helix domain-containing protein n=1 Tax=Paenibacillus wulumuqiensis TaxID=1567107 RepID=UPI00061A02D0|nr:helix-turn-helix transcriptional regulator [Paenibacillus wulumuqiensis]
MNLIGDSMLDYRYIGQRIREVRQQRGMTQQQLAMGICNQSQISRIEKGVESVSADTLYRIARKCGVDVRIFYDMAQNEISEMQNIRKNILYLQRQQMYPELIEYIEHCQTEESGRLSVIDQQFILCQKGYAYLQLGQIPCGFQMIQQALKLTYHTDRLPALYEVEVILALAAGYALQGDQRSCISWLHKCRQSLHQYRELDYRFPEVFYCLARAYNASEDYRLAIEYASQGIRYCEDHRFCHCLEKLYYECGYSYEQLGQSGKAERCYARSRMLSELFCLPE